MVSKKNSVRVKNDGVTFIQSGSNLVKHKTCFASDVSGNLYMFVIAGSAVKVYSVSTEECINVFNNDEGNLVSMFLNPLNRFQLITVSETACISVWNFEDAILVKKYEKIYECSSVLTCIPTNGTNSFILISKEHQIMKVEVKDSKASAKEIINLDNFSPDTDIYKFSQSGKYFVILRDNLLQVHSVQANHHSRRHLIQDTLHFTCVEWHPSDECIATGLNIGRIILWYKYFDKKPFKSTVHWHSLPVADICFSPSGNYFYSGGKECTLVKWQTQSGEKRFLPRLGLPICRISSSPNGDVIATNHIDNSITLINQNNESTGVIQGLTQSNHWTDIDLPVVPTGLLYDNRTSSLVLNGKPGHLQFYKIREDKLLFNLDIAQENYIHEERNFKIYNSEVVKAAFSTHGDWLATVQYRNDKETNMELYLKFWKYNEENKNFSLCTSFEMPHDEMINCLKFQPVEHHLLNSLAVTTADDKRFRIWSLNSQQNDSGSSWMCQNIGFFRNEKAGDASFSEDGSLLCVTFGRYLTLWLPDENVLSGFLINEEDNGIIKKAEFGRKECYKILIGYTDNYLTAWDLDSLKVMWTVDVQLSCLVSDPVSSIMAAFDKEGILFLFKPINENPIHIYEHKGKNIIGAVFSGETPLRSFEHSELYFLSSEQLIYILMKEKVSDNASVKAKKIFGTRNTSLTPLGLMLAEEHKSKAKQATETLKISKSSKGEEIIDMILNTPCYAQPSPNELCTSYLNALLEEKKITNEESEQIKTITSKAKETSKKSTDKKIKRIAKEFKSNGVKLKEDTITFDNIDVESIIQQDFSWVKQLF